MTDATQDQTTDDIDFGRSRKGPSVVGLLLFAAIGAGAGGFVGGPAVAPMIAQVAEGGLPGGGGHGDDDGHGGGGGGEQGPLTIENLILNPAGTGASRFLIVTLVLEADEEARAELESRDAEVRDLLLTVLSSKTVEELTDISRRNRIREDMRMALNDLLAFEGVHRIFLPQFVIQ